MNPLRNKTIKNKNGSRKKSNTYKLPTTNGIIKNYLEKMGLCWLKHQTSIVFLGARIHCWTALWVFSSETLLAFYMTSSLCVGWLLLRYCPWKAKTWLIMRWVSGLLFLNDGESEQAEKAEDYQSNSNQVARVLIDLEFSFNTRIASRLLM